ncbi:MAG: ATP synthase F1 subunit delta [Leptospiraceae bacterium]|nr:ATP synthase F1 subunit delta [Leptospiraceae bacterium]MDW8306028.1 ATP synthase F1 subunit delta [Leptospiraceae bacterium]
MKQGVYRNYALALLETGVSLEEAERFLLSIREACQKSRKLRLFLESPRVRLSEKRRFLEKVLGDKISPLLLNFLCILISHGRFGELDKVISAFMEEVDHRLGRLRLEITVARDFGQDQALLEQMEAVVKELWIKRGYLDPRDYQYIWKIKTDPEILGGVKIKLGDYLLDGSVQRYLKEWAFRAHEKKREIRKSWHI